MSTQVQRAVRIAADFRASVADRAHELRSILDEPPDGTVTDPQRRVLGEAAAALETYCIIMESIA